MYQTSLKVTVFRLVMLTRAFGINGLSAVPDAQALRLVVVALDAICSPAGKDGFPTLSSGLPSCSTTVVGIASTSQPGVSAPTTKTGLAAARRLMNETMPIS